MAVDGGFTVVVDVMRIVTAAVLLAPHGAWRAEASVGEAVEAVHKACAVVRIAVDAVMKTATHPDHRPACPWQRRRYNNDVMIKKDNGTR